MAGKMVICIIHPNDTQGVVQALNQEGFRVTQMSTTGGFLRQGNVTLMIGVEESQVDPVMNIVRNNTHPHASKGWWRRPGKHQTSAATVFVMDMEQARLA